MNGRYRRIATEADGSLRSLTAGLLLRTEGKRLRLVDAATGEPLPWGEELGAQISRKGRRGKQPRNGRTRRLLRGGALEEELERLRRELKRGS